MFFRKISSAVCRHGQRAVCLCLCFLALWSSVGAQTVDEPTARRRAAVVFERLSAATSPASRSRSVTPSSLTLVAERSAGRLYADGKGHFALMSADERWPEVLAYGSCPDANMASASALLAPWLQLYDRRYKSGLATAAEAYDGPVVAPLLSAVRHQLAPYNNLCPYYTADDGTVSPERCVVGCVATALEEVISFHRPVVTLQDLSLIHI